MRRAIFALLTLAGCAQPPDRELDLVASRIEEVTRIEGAVYAPELLAQSESELAEARRLALDDGDYRESIRVAAVARARADAAYAKASSEKQLTARHVARLLEELEGLIDIARSHGADRENEVELARFEQRRAGIAEVALRGDLLTALAEGESLKPELIDFEKRFR
jgi:hypothetical protein